MFKNNIERKLVKYGIKKLSFGIASVAIGTLVFLGGTASAHGESRVNDNVSLVHEKLKNVEINLETTNNLDNKNNKESNNISTGSTTTSVSEKNTENKNIATDSTLTTEFIGKTDNKEVEINSDSQNSNLNVLDKRIDDSSDIANLLTKIINKNLEENKVTTEEVENIVEPVEKGTKIISRLTSKYAEDIAKGYIGLEGGKYDSLIYKKAILNPDGDDDGDGIANKDELYIYKKDGRTYLGYDIHPRLADTDGDGLNDKEDKDKLIWNVSARDMAMFINLVYENDKKIDDILKKQAPAGTLSNNIQKMTNNELGPYWRVKETFHQDNGLDAVLFETTNNFPFLKGDNIQVLAFAGTNVVQAGDLKADLALFFGNESNQSEAAIQLMKKIKKDSTITNLYITGHSLGGYLSLRATATAEKEKFGKYKQTYTFNAPKVKSGWLWGVPKDDVKISEELAKSGKIKNYYTDNDNIIPGNLQPENKISIGKSAGAHSSTSYFENRVNSNPDFNFGKRQGMDGVGYRDENINNLSIIDPENGTLSKTFLPTLVDDKPVSIMIGDKLKDKDIISKVNRNLLPVNTKLSLVYKDELTSLGTKHATVRVAYLDDNSSNDINIPISVNEADKKELISVVNVAQKLVESVVDLSDKTKKSAENYNLSKSTLTEKLKEAEATISNTLSPQLTINNITRELASLGLDVINSRTTLELTEAGKYEPKILNDEKLLLRQGNGLNINEVLNKIIKGNLPQNINYEILNSTDLAELGDVNARVKVTYSDGSSDIINVPIRVYKDSKDEPLVQEENPELVISEKGEPLVQEENPELVISEKGESIVQEENPELVISEKGESLVQPELPEFHAEKGEPLVQEENPELVISEKGEPLVQEENPKSTLELLNSSKFGVEVELLANINNISLNVKKIENSNQIKMISRKLSVEKDKIRVLDLKLSKDNNEVQLENDRIVRIALLENESSEIKIYHVEKNGSLTLIPSEVKNGIVKFNINHFSLFVIVDFSKTVPRNENDKLKEISLDAKKEISTTNKINEQENITTISKELNSKPKEVAQVVEEKYNVRNNRENSRSNIKVDKLDSLNNNFKQNTILPKTGGNSSNTIPIITGLGLIIGVLGIRKYNIDR
ncbi:Rib/alpha-like domain-containing protein [Gemella haemolysans]|uniref:Rib/alpha-like domain-containing protein n=1 Tax=Gemella haemolysans TaxID=1379 RepID=UPI00195D26C3|nr:Rib/alpha-like domain-containing protein [Gemella haemolysans]VTX82635.1 IgA FC receptor [Gemella haemolysans]